eukprot:2608472-Rhodomonas_salina.2
MRSWRKKARACSACLGAFVPGLREKCGINSSHFTCKRCRSTAPNPAAFEREIKPTQPPSPYVLYRERDAVQLIPV